MSTALTEVSAIPTIDARLVPDDLLYEVVNGQTVELTPMGTKESLLGNFLCQRMHQHARRQRLGIAVTEMLFDLKGDGSLQRRPDVAFVSRQRWSNAGSVTSDAAWRVVPDLVVEMVSPSNTFSEITTKIHEYFAVGVRQVWIVIPASEETYVYDSPQSPRVIRWTDELSGEPVLPGFRVKLMDLIQEEFPE